MIRALLVSVFVILSFAGCRKEDSRPGFDFQIRQDFVIPAGIGVFQVHHFYLRNIPTRMTQLLEQRALKPEDLTGILTNQGALTGIFGDANFDFIDQISIRIYEDARPTNFLEAAFRQPMPLDPGNEVVLIPTLADLSKFLKADLVSVDVALWLRRTTTEETPARLDLQFRATY